MLAYYFSLIDTMHLDRMPLIMVRGTETRRAFYTVQKSEWEKEGFAVSDETAPEEKSSKTGPAPEKAVEAGGNAFEVQDEDEEDYEEVLEAMTKNELLEFALENGIDLKNNQPKSQILEACKEILKAQN